MSAKKIKPDFSHRLSTLDRGVATCSLSDAIDDLADNAINVLHLVNMNFTGNEDIDRPSDELIFWSIDSAIKSINDIKAIVSAYHELSKTERPEGAAA